MIQGTVSITKTIVIENYGSTKKITLEYTQGSSIVFLRLDDTTSIPLTRRLLDSLYMCIPSILKEITDEDSYRGC